MNTVYGLNFRGHVPGRIGVGDNLHVVARVDHFERRTGLFLLEPVSTRVR